MFQSPFDGSLNVCARKFLKKRATPRKCPYLGSFVVGDSLLVLRLSVTWPAFFLYRIGLRFVCAMLLATPSPLSGKLESFWEILPRLLARCLCRLTLSPIQPWKVQARLWQSSPSARSNRPFEVLIRHVAFSKASCLDKELSSNKKEKTESSKLWLPLHPRKTDFLSMIGPFKTTFWLRCQSMNFEAMHSISLLSSRLRMHSRDR